MDNITIQGIEYHVIKRLTPELAENEGHHNLAREMRKYGTVDLTLKRVKGKKLYSCVLYKNGNYSKVLTIP